MTARLSVEAAGRTHLGLVRQRNEDSFYQGEWLNAVADGLGGHVAGDIASTTVIKALKPYDRRVRSADLTNVLGQAIDGAGEALRQRIRAEPELTGMGTTLVAVLRSDDEVVVANVGDSRAYLIPDVGADPGTMTQITQDHTYQQLVADAAAVPYLPGRLTRFLDGRKDGRSPDLIMLRLHPGDRILLCSDGLSSYVPPETIRAALNAADGPDGVADRLIASALGHGGQDNVTVIVIDVQPLRPTAAKPENLDGSTCTGSSGSGRHCGR
jgi:PPM family protein phosphatase